jgi:ferricrocin synthase
VTLTSAIPGAAELKKHAQAINLPLHCILLASSASLQAYHSSSDHATFGLWHAGRTGPVSNILNLAIPRMNVLPMHIPVSDDLLEVARMVQQDLRKRTPLIQQTSLLNIDEWVTGGKGLPLTNVFVNVFERAKRDSAQEAQLFGFVEVFCLFLSGCRRRSSSSRLTTPYRRNHWYMRNPKSSTHCLLPSCFRSVYECQ